jgi:FtsZ-binding cell division protein ZapB
MSITPVKRVEQAETEIAVLRVRFDNLDEKMDDLKLEVQDLHKIVDRNMLETKTILKDFQNYNKKSHDEISDKISSIEKIKWMLLGAAALIGATGVEAIRMIFSV